MLLPQFTIRRMLALMAVCGVLFLVLSMAVAGHAWAIGISVAIGSVVVVFAVYAALFFGIWLLTLLPWGGGRLPPTRSPFATVDQAAADQPPATPFRIEGT